MEFNLEAMLWYALAADCSFAFTVSWFLKDWYDSAVPEYCQAFSGHQGLEYRLPRPYPVVRFCTDAGRRFALVKPP